MKILITGNLGYVGSVLARHLRTVWPAARLVGCDNGYFAHCLTGAACLPECDLDEQHFADVRFLPESVLAGVDAVVLLAAISNDPMGNRFEAVTDEINHKASVEVARRALATGARRIVFASSCSAYGADAGAPRREADPLNPLTAYARSKVAAEAALAALPAGDATITSLRFATACGMSDRLRLDLVLNDFVACAKTSGEITVLSDGTPWRPLIDVHDMARAIEWALTREARAGGACLSVNVGADSWNYQVRDLAHAVAAAFPGTRVSINSQAPADRRSYRVDFGLYERLAPDHQPRKTLQESIADLKAGMERANFSDPDFRGSSFMRLKALERHIDQGSLDSRLRWTTRGANDR